MCVGPSKKGSRDDEYEKLLAEARTLGLDTTGFTPTLVGKVNLLSKVKAARDIAANGGTDPRLPAASPIPTPNPTMGLRLPRSQPVGVSSLKLPRR
jgi:hypothetical protein